MANATVVENVAQYTDEQGLRAEHHTHWGCAPV